MSSNSKINEYNRGRINHTKNMKKVLKIFTLTICIILIVLVSFAIYAIILTRNVKLDKNKLINLNDCITYYYSNGEKITEETNGKQTTCLNKIPKHVKNAFIAIEDKRFYTHNGIDIKSLFRATYNNIKSLSFKEGGSTISQQLIKNTHLTSEKTFKRKIYEIKLALDLEKNYNKDEILEMYLNTIYFGEGCYGITMASKHYFNKDVETLSINEGAVLAGIIKSPANYSLDKKENCKKRKNLVLAEMLKQDYVTHNEYQNNIVLECEKSYCHHDFSLMDHIRKKAFNLIENKPYYNKNLKIYTTIDKEKQIELENNLKKSNKNAIILLDNKNNILSYSSNIIEERRQVGSTLKPFIAYAPALEENQLYPTTKISDKKENHNGYSPSNYKNIEYGYLTMNEALQKSVNTIPVKLLKIVGVEKAKNYLRKTNFPFDSEDNSLCLALGATKYGATLLEITALYNIFQNQGEFYQPNIINKIQDGNKIIYEKKEQSSKIFSPATCGLINDALNSVVNIGTAKALSSLPFQLYSKTGTVGNKKGNTDAYSISYNKDYTLGVWEGNNDNSYLENNITGGGSPTRTAKNIWGKLYKEKTAPSRIEEKDIIELEIDKELYDKENIVQQADPNAPSRYKFNAKFKKDYFPKNYSSNFSNPKIKNCKLQVRNNEINIELCVAEYCGYKIFKRQNNDISMVYEGRGSFNFIDKDITPNTEYEYSILPFFNNGKETFYGAEVILSKIKSPSFNYDGDDWWLND